MKTINERIRYLRKEILDINQSEFAKRIKVKQTTVSFMEKEGSTITDQNAEFICTAFGVSKDWLINGIGEPLSEEALEDEYTRAVTEIDVKDPKARQAILDYWKMSDIDKQLWWNFMDRFIKKEQED